MAAQMGERIRAARGALRLTRAALAARSGVPFESLSNYELGRAKPGAEALEKLAQAGISPAWLLLGQEPMLSAGQRNLDRAGGA